MQVKLKQNASEIFQSKYGVESQYIDLFMFLKENEWKDIFVHWKIGDDLIEASQYQNWKKWEIPEICFEFAENQDPEPVKPSILDRIKWLSPVDYIVPIIFITLILIYIFYPSKKEEPIKAPERHKTALELLTEKQQINLNRIGAKMETQRIIKSQISELKGKLDQNIAEVRTIELENSTIREQMIEETSK